MKQAIGVCVILVVICGLLIFKGCFGGGGGGDSGGESETNDVTEITGPSFPKKVASITKKGFSYQIDGKGDYDFESLEKAVKAMPSEIKIDYSSLKDNQETHERVQEMIKTIRH